jgi:hypothetical protein
MPVSAVEFTEDASLSAKQGRSRAVLGAESKYSACASSKHGRPKSAMVCAGSRVLAVSHRERSQ